MPNATAPETGRSTHYLWSLSRCFETEDEKLSEAPHARIMTIFSEDRTLLEVRQRRSAA